MDQWKKWDIFLLDQERVRVRKKSPPITRDERRNKRYYVIFRVIRDFATVLPIGENSIIPSLSIPIEPSKSTGLSKTSFIWTFEQYSINRNYFSKKKVGTVPTSLHSHVEALLMQFLNFENIDN